MSLRSRTIICCLAAAFASLILAVSVAFADDTPVVIPYDPPENPVADRTVHLNVNKLDANTHEYVKGAKLQVIDKKTKEVMIEWTSGDETAELERVLDVDTPYILREITAPEGYEKAYDVEFTLRSVNFETKGEVSAGATTPDGDTNAEFNNVSGSIENQAFVITLYDAKEGVELTEKRVEERPNTRTESNEKHTSYTQPVKRNNTTSRNQTVPQNTETSRNETTSSSQPRNNVVVRNNTQETVPQNQQTETTRQEVTRDVVPDTTNDVTYDTTYETTYAAAPAQVVNETSDIRTVTPENLTKTGDTTSYVPMYIVAVLGIGAICFAVWWRNRK